MSQYKEHRLYLYMSEPVRFLGMTTGELVLGLGGLFGFLFNSGDLLTGTIILISGWGSIYAMRQFKKQKLGLNVRSMLTWYGLIPAPSTYWPSFENKRWVG